MARKRNPVAVTCIYIYLLIITAIVVFPIFWILMTSFKTDVQMFAIPPEWIPDPFTLKHYTEVLFQSSFLHQLANSLVISITSTAIALLAGIPSAYGFARYAKKRNRRVVFSLVTAVRMVPQIVMVVPYFLLLSSMRMSDTRTALIIVYIPFQMTLVIWILKNFFQTVPLEIEEAASIDGLGPFGTLSRIVTPLCKSSIGVSAMLAFLYAWNEFMFALSLTSRNAQPLTVGIAGNVTSFQTFWGRMSASGMMFILPAVLLTLLFQKGMVKGLTAGAVKG